MTGFIDVLLRGLLLSLVSVAVGGVAWIHLVAIGMLLLIYREG